MLRDIFINGVAASWIIPRKVRRIIYTLYGMNIHTFRISPHCFMGGNKLSVGRNSFINYGNFFDLSDSISIGENARIAMCCKFIIGSHEIGMSEKWGGYLLGLGILLMAVN